MHDIMDAGMVVNRKTIGTIARENNVFTEVVPIVLKKTLPKRAILLAYNPSAIC